MIHSQIAALSELLLACGWQETKKGLYIKAKCPSIHLHPKMDVPATLDKIGCALGLKCPNNLVLYLMDAVSTEITYTFDAEQLFKDIWRTKGDEKALEDEFKNNLIEKTVAPIALMIDQSMVKKGVVTDLEALFFRSCSNQSYVSPPACRRKSTAKKELFPEDIGEILKKDVLKPTTKFKKHHSAYNRQDFDIVLSIPRVLQHPLFKQDLGTKLGLLHLRAEFINAQYAASATGAWRACCEHAALNLPHNMWLSLQKLFNIKLDHPLLSFDVKPPTPIRMHLDTSHYQ